MAHCGTEWEHRMAWLRGKIRWLSSDSLQGHFFRHPKANTAPDKA